MKKGTKIAIACAVAVVALMTVLIVVNPFGMGGNNEVPNNPENPNGGSNPENTEGEAEVTNPDAEGTIEATCRISPGKVYLDDDHMVDGKGAYVAGTSREGLLTIWNLNDYEAVFSVDYRIPDSPIVGYYRPTEQVRDWVWISNKWPTIPANGKVDITIRLGMPESATPPGPLWEFWIAVIDQSQTGWLKVELASRFLVTMK